MRLVGVVLVMLASSGMASAEPDQQFDLVCTKEARQKVVGSRRYRIDLQSMRWCMDACAAPKGIQAATAAKITLAASDPADRSETITHEIDRSTGRYVDAHISRRWVIAEVSGGQCELAPFSGLPAPKF